LDAFVDFDDRLLQWRDLRFQPATVAKVTGIINDHPQAVIQQLEPVALDHALAQLRRPFPGQALPIVRATP
jgi:hypothetical protein